MDVVEVGSEPLGATSKNPTTTSFPAVSAEKMMKVSTEMRRINVPRHRYSPLKANWQQLYEPIVEQLKLQIRFNLKTRCIEIKMSPETGDIGAVQKAADFLNAFIVGFSVADSLALIRLDDLYVESFEVEDVKPLKGEHKVRAIGRVAGHNGKTKYSIENATRTLIVLADDKIHILGSFANIALARRAICNLILGSPPSKVYGSLRGMAQRAVERF